MLLTNPIKYSLNVQTLFCSIKGPCLQQQSSLQAPRVRNTGIQEGLSQPAHGEDPRGVTGTGRDQTMHFLLCFPFPSAPWFYSCRKDRGRGVKTAESGHVRGASERLSQHQGQRTKPCAEAELSRHCRVGQAGGTGSRTQSPA